MVAEESAGSDKKPTTALIIGFIAAVAVFTVAISLFIIKPWQSTEYKECVSTLEQLHGGEDVPDSIVDNECGPYE